MGQSTAMRWKRPLYIMVKPTPAALPELRRVAAMLGIESNYSQDRVHCTFLPLGESMPATIDAVHHALLGFHAAPFRVMFDHVEGATLKPRKGLREPRVFQRALAHRLAAAGLSLPRYEFGLHMNLAYGQASNRRAAIPLLDWTVEEILLIESVNGKGRHIDRGCWRLIPAQGALDF